MNTHSQIKSFVSAGLDKVGLLNLVRPIYHSLRLRFNPPRFHGGEVELPRHLNLATTFVCLAACPHCIFIQEDNHVFRGKKSMDDDLGDLSFNASWARKLDSVSFGGGESLLHPRLFTWLKMARDHGLSSRQIVTNGVPLQQDEIVERLLETPALFTNLQISLDADNADDYKAAKGIKKVDFNKILDSISRITSVHKDNPDVTILTSFVVGAHNVGDTERLIRLSERLGLDNCHMHTLHIVTEEGNSYKNDTLRNLPAEYNSLMKQTDFNINITLSPPIREPYLGYYCSSLAEDVSIDPQGRMAVCCHIAWDKDVGMIEQFQGNPSVNSTSTEMRRQFIAAADNDDVALLPEPCRLCGRRLIGNYHFDSKTKKWSYNYR